MRSDETTLNMKRGRRKHCEAYSRESAHQVPLMWTACRNCRRRSIAMESLHAKSRVFGYTIASSKPIYRLLLGGSQPVRLIVLRGGGSANRTLALGETQHKQLGFIPTDASKPSNLPVTSRCFGMSGARIRVFRVTSRCWPQEALRVLLSPVVSLGG